MPEYHVTPVAKVRMTQRDKNKKDVRPRVARWLAFKDRIKELGVPPIEDWDSVMFVMPMPKSWPLKRRQEMCGKPCRSKPDLDNLLGGLMDACMPDGDQQLAALSSLFKVWGTDGKVVVSKPYELAQQEERKRRGWSTKMQLGMQLTAASSSRK